MSKSPEVQYHQDMHRVYRAVRRHVLEFEKDPSAERILELFRRQTVRLGLHPPVFFVVDED